MGHCRPLTLGEERSPASANETPAPGDSLPMGQVGIYCVGCGCGGEAKGVGWEKGQPPVRLNLAHWPLIQHGLRRVKMKGGGAYTKQEGMI